MAFWTALESGWSLHTQQQQRECTQRFSEHIPVCLTAEQGISRRTLGHQQNHGLQAVERCRGLGGSPAEQGAATLARTGGHHGYDVGVDDGALL